MSSEIEGSNNSTSAAASPPRTASSVEVTHQDFCRGIVGESTSSSKLSPSSSPTRILGSSVTPVILEDSSAPQKASAYHKTKPTMAKLIGNMLTTRSRRNSGSRRGGGGGGGGVTSSNGSVTGDDNASVSIVSDNATLHSYDGQQSVAKTIESIDTVKHSNRQPKKYENNKTSMKPPAPPPPNATTTTTTSSPSITKKTKGWMKRLVNGAKPKSTTPATPPKKGGAGGIGHPHQWVGRAHARSYDGGARSVASSPAVAYGIRDRVESVDGILKERSRYSSSSSRAHLDLAIRGRLDGMDVLFLGPARRVSLPSAAETKQESPVKNGAQQVTDGGEGDGKNPQVDIDPSSLSFTGMPTSYTAAEMVSDMVSTSAGRDQLEIIFEGYIPGGGDRWCVKLEDTNTTRRSLQQQQQVTAPTTISVKAGEPEKDWIGTIRTYNTATTASAAASVDADDESTAATADVTADDGSPMLPMQRLWDRMWGEDLPPPIPSHMQTGGGSFDEGNMEDVLQLAAACSVPIDIDDDCFIIDSPEHLRSVHDLVMVPIQRRRFDDALSIFDKLLKGLQSPSNSKHQHLVGTTHHNIGLVHTCQGNFGDALESFKRAVVVRNECLPPNHPDIAVSLVREGIAYLALESYDDAINSLKSALGMTPAENATRSKILNNLGVVQYQRGDLTLALESFTSALEIQRQWLDGPVRREPIVYDASVSLSNMGKVYLDKKDYELAFYVLEEACLLQTTTFRKDHDIVLATLGSMALTKTKNSEYKKAIQLYSSILRSQEAKFGIDSQEAMETAGMLGYVHTKQVDFEDAFKHFQRVEHWQTNNLPSSHPAIRMTKDTILAIKKCMSGTASVWI